MCVWTHTHAHTQDLHGITRFLHLEPLDNRALFVRTLERPIKARASLGLKRLQVGRAGQVAGWAASATACVCVCVWLARLLQSCACGSGLAGVAGGSPACLQHPDVPAASQPAVTPSPSTTPSAPAGQLQVGWEAGRGR